MTDKELLKGIAQRLSNIDLDQLTEAEKNISRLLCESNYMVHVPNKEHPNESFYSVPK